MARCRVCGSRSPLTTSSLGVCAPCIRAAPYDLSSDLARVHAQTRRNFGLPPEPPCDRSGMSCDLCANQCQIPPDQLGYCGLRRNVRGRLVGAAPTQGKLGYIASLDPDLPYSLLAFHPQFFLHDLPVTSRDDAEEALAAARAAGLTRVRIGNRHLLAPSSARRDSVTV